MQRAKNIQKLKTRILIALFSVILLICSRISIPYVIPFSLQSLGIFLTLGILGGKRGLLSILIYLALGLIGIPISATGEAGINLFLTPTAGYLIGWILCGILFWIIETKFGNRNKTRIIAFSIGTIVCYIVGTIWFVLICTHNNTTISVWTALCYCVFPFILFDIIKLLIANAITNKLHNKITIEQ